MTVTAGPQVSYGLSAEQEALRASVRASAETVVAPRSAEVDRTATCPWDLHEGLRRNELLALHVPEAYGGAGADAISTADVIEELSRVDASVGLIVAVGELGTTGRLHDRLPGRALHARCQDHAGLRGHQPCPAGRHGPVAAALGRRSC